MIEPREATPPAGVAYYRHLYPWGGRLRELLASGELGRPVFALAQAFDRFDPQPVHRARGSSQIRGRGGRLGLRCHRMRSVDSGPGRGRARLPEPALSRSASRDTASRTPFRQGRDALWRSATPHASPAHLRDPRPRRHGAVACEPAASAVWRRESAGTTRRTQPDLPLVEDFVLARARIGRRRARRGRLAVNRLRAAITVRPFQHPLALPRVQDAFVTGSASCRWRSPARTPIYSCSTAVCALSSCAARAAGQLRLSGPNRAPPPATRRSLRRGLHYPMFKDCS